METPKPSRKLFNEFTLSVIEDIVIVAFVVAVVYAIVANDMFAVFALLILYAIWMARKI